MIIKKRVLILATAISFLLPSIVTTAKVLNNERDKIVLKQGEQYEIVSYSTIANNNKNINLEQEKEFVDSYSDEYEGSTPGFKVNKDNTMDTTEYIESKSDEIGNYKVIKRKTDSKYEVALAYSDGSYTYVENTEDLDLAINKVKEIEKILSDKEIIPTVIGENGQVIYSTNSMGRVWTHIDGIGIQGSGYTATVYADNNKDKAFTYINHAYIEDVPVIQDTGAMAQVQVNGNNGWLVKDINAKQYDLVMIPINQVKNPSFYYVENGLLYHYISTNMTKEFVAVNDWDIELGIAPSYLKEGVHYLSYDGRYFYDGSNIQEGLEKLINDLKLGVNKNSINYSNQYYNYFQNLPFRTKSEYTAEEINSFIRNSKYTGPTSKLQGIGDALIKAQEQYGVNALLTLGVAVNESNWGNSTIAQEKNNIFGLKAIDSNPGLESDSYPTVEACVMDFAKNYISRDYADPAGQNFYGGILGNKNRGANVKYASDPYWGEKAAQYAAKIDYLMGNKVATNMKDYQNYQLIKFTGVNEVKNEKDGQLLYSVIDNLFDFGTYTETIVAISSKNYLFDNANTKYIRINPERTTPIKIGNTVNVSDGIYEWEEKALIKSNNVELVSTAKNTSNKYIKEDVTGNGIVDIEDISTIALNYNKASSIWAGENIYDINGDNVIDIYDIIIVSTSLK